MACRATFAATIHDGFTAEERGHWAFQPVQQPAVPSVRPSAGSNPIDAFIEAKLEARGLSLAPMADKITLLRRAALDLTGVPPSPVEVERFLSEASADAYDQLVDRLLASNQYGERWARYWLDLARYAESEGFKSDETRPNAWRYRDYVIKAFAQDKPYDRFIREQIAGDELWPGDPEALVATGFNRHYPDESNARNLMQRRQEILNDITDTVGAVFTGLTYGCARCHDHKFDPIRQTDYYRLQAFFANTAAADRLVLASPAAAQRYCEQQARWEQETAFIREEIEVLEAPKRQEIIKEYVDKYPEEIQSALAKPPAERNSFECQMVAKANLYLDSRSPQYIAPSKIVAGRLKGYEKQRWDELQEKLQEFADLCPPELPMATGMTDLSDSSPLTYVLRRGNWDAPKSEVQPGFLSILDPEPAKIVPPTDGHSTGRRTTLANILTDKRNPLTARVMANRIWQHHFGRGIVATPSDFGLKGDRPTHPELLDWLASEFVDHGWSIKHLQRLIMTSRTYQQVSTADPQLTRVDPDNLLLGHYPRHRLEAEAIRDSCLAVAGLLNSKMGGPGVFPELPQGMRRPEAWPVTDDAAECNRRSIYIFVRRNVPYPLLEVFDLPDTHESCSRRNETTSPIQALALLNSSLSLEWAEHFAGRVLKIAGADQQAQLATAFRLAYSRAPTVAEEKLVTRFYERQQVIVRRRLGQGEELALPSDLLVGVEPVQAAVLVDLCQMLLNSNEFVYFN
jgi:hypothetical protein